MNSATNHGERLSSLAENSPIYSAFHESAGIAVVKIVDYEDWVCSKLTNLVSYLHGVHLLLDGMVVNYGFYKVDFTEGIFTIAANISGPENIYAASDLLQFAVEVIKSLKLVKSPLNSKPLRVQVALSMGPVRSSILGKTALKFSIHGKAEIVPKRLLSTIGQDQEIVASLDFINALEASTSRDVWMQLPFQSDALVQEAYLYKPQDYTINEKCDAHQRRFFSSYSDPTKERRFRQFQAPWLIGADMLYLGFTLSRLVHCSFGLEPLPALLLTLIPIFAALTTKFYLDFRKQVLAISFCITSFFYLWKPCPFSVEWASNIQLSFLDIQTIGAFLIFPVQILLPIFSFIVWITYEWIYNLQGTFTIEITRVLFKALCHFSVVFALPLWISFKIEQKQRQHHLSFIEEKSKDDRRSARYG